MLSRKVGGYREKSEYWRYQPRVERGGKKKKEVEEGKGEGKPLVTDIE